MSDERDLLECWRRLDAHGRRSLLDYAQFLAGRCDAAAAPLPQPRREDESVVQAIRRLNRAYPMLKKHELAARVEQLLAQHMVEGREAREVIGELEEFYGAQYASHAARVGG